MNKRMNYLLMLGLGLLLTACSAGSKEKAEEQETKSNNKSAYRIGIIQIAEHSALDENREGFLKALEEAGIQAEIDYKNAQGDLNNALAISKKFVDDKVDLIFAIATPAAQAAKQATKDSEIPVLFSAVTDPVQAQLVESLEKPNANITGTSDKTPIKQQLSIFESFDVKNIGVIYNTAETNSETQLKEAEFMAKELGLTIVPVGITTINDIPKALEVLLQKTEGMYVLTDNLVASSLELISKFALDNRYIIVQSYIDETDAAEGILISNGFSYHDLGKQTGEMAVSVLKGEKTAAEIPVGNIEKTENMVRQKALDAFDINPDLPIIKEARIK